MVFISSFTKKMSILIDSKIWQNLKRTDYGILSNIVNFEISMNKLLMHVKTNNISVKLTLRSDLH